MMGNSTMHLWTSLFSSQENNSSPLMVRTTSTMTDQAYLDVVQKNKIHPVKDVKFFDIAECVTEEGFGMSLKDVPRELFGTWIRR